MTLGPANTSRIRAQTGRNRHERDCSVCARSDPFVPVSRLYTLSSIRHVGHALLLSGNSETMWRACRPLARTRTDSHGLARTRTDTHGQSTEITFTPNTPCATPRTFFETAARDVTRAIRSGGPKETIRSITARKYRATRNRRLRGASVRVGAHPCQRCSGPNETFPGSDRRGDVVTVRPKKKLPSLFPHLDQRRRGRQPLTP